jgi:hypothetical protein
VGLDCQTLFSYPQFEPACYPRGIGMLTSVPALWGLVKRSSTSRCKWDQLKLTRDPDSSGTQGLSRVLEGSPRQRRRAMAEAKLFSPAPTSTARNSRSTSPGSRKALLPRPLRRLHSQRRPRRRNGSARARPKQRRIRRRGLKRPLTPLVRLATDGCCLDCDCVGNWIESRVCVLQMLWRGSMCSRGWRIKSSGWSLRRWRCDSEVVRRRKEIEVMSVLQCTVIIMVIVQFVE